MQLCIYCMMTGVLPAGFPHSDIGGSPDICSSPPLFAACHVLLRLLMPRHPPCALSCLTLLRIALRIRSGLFALCFLYYLAVILLDVLISLFISFNVQFSRNNQAVLSSHKIRKIFSHLIAVQAILKQLVYIIRSALSGFPVIIRDLAATYLPMPSPA